MYIQELVFLKNSFPLLILNGAQTRLKKMGRILKALRIGKIWPKIKIMKSRNYKSSFTTITLACFLLSYKLIFAQNIAEDHIRENFKILKDVSYDTDEEQNMDIYLSKETNSFTKKVTIICKWRFFVKNPSFSTYEPPLFFVAWENNSFSSSYSFCPASYLRSMESSSPR